MDDFGILVFGHRRPEHLRLVLESLKRQGALGAVHVWIDGYSHSPELAPRVEATRALEREFAVAGWTNCNGRYGIERLMLDGLRFMADRYRDILVLEDDCFPTVDAIELFRQELDEVRHDPTIYSVYGHHFRVPGETPGEPFPRFQGWGWATTAEKLRPVLEELRRKFLMPEPEYLAWTEASLTPEVVARLDVTPGRNVVPLLRKQYSWDSATALVTALAAQSHRPTRSRIVYNCGAGDQSGHFPRLGDGLRAPPFNMVGLDEVRELLNAHSDPGNDDARPWRQQPAQVQTASRATESTGPHSTSPIARRPGSAHLPSFTHVVNFFAAPEGSEHARAQALVLTSIDRASAVAASHGVRVEALSASYRSDLPCVKPPLRAAHPLLRRGVLDKRTSGGSRLLPYLADILKAGYVSGQHEYMIYSNADIVLQPEFYVELARIVSSGAVCGSILRRTVYGSPDGGQEDYDTLRQVAGDPHPGHDCLFFPRSWVPSFHLGRVFLGAVPVARTLLMNLDAISGYRAKVLGGVRLTFHVDDPRTWQSRAYLTARNYEHAAKAVREITATYGFPGPESWTYEQLSRFWEQHTRIVDHTRRTPAMRIRQVIARELEPRLRSLAWRSRGLGPAAAGAGMRYEVCEERPWEIPGQPLEDEAMEIMRSGMRDKESVIQELKQACDERLELIDRLHAELQSREAPVPAATARPAG